jgi:hypothetical protein
MAVVLLDVAFPSMGFPCPRSCFADDESATGGVMEFRYSIGATAERQDLVSIRM